MATPRSSFTRPGARVALRRPHAPRSRRRPADPSSAPVTGVRIGGTGVAVAVAAAAGGTVPAARAEGHVRLPAGAVRDGEVHDAAAVARALRAATEGRQGLPPQVRLGIAGPKVAVRTLDLPPVQRDEDVPAVVRALARERIPTAAGDAVVDFSLLPPADGDDGRRALVVAARRELVEGHVVAARAAGLEPVGVDLVAFGLARAVPIDAPTLLLDLDGVTTLAIASPDGCRFVRTVPAGVASAAEELSGRTGRDAASAEAALLGEEELDAEAAASRAAVVAATVRAIGTAVRTTVDAQARSGVHAAPTACLVSGALAGADGVAGVLADVLELPVRPAGAGAGGADPVALGLSVPGDA